jgi:hypothetical protein
LSQIEQAKRFYRFSEIRVSPIRPRGSSSGGVRMRATLLFDQASNKKGAPRGGSGKVKNVSFRGIRKVEIVIFQKCRVFWAVPLVVSPTEFQSPKAGVYVIKLPKTWTPLIQLAAGQQLELRTLQRQIES